LVTQWGHERFPVVAPFADANPTRVSLRFGLFLTTGSEIRDDFRPRTPLATRALLLRASTIVVGRSGLTRLRRVHRRLDLVRAAAILGRHGRSRLDDRVADRTSDQADGTDRVIVPRNRYGEQIGIRVRV